jgi:hypothetical protein
MATNAVIREEILGKRNNVCWLSGIPEVHLSGMPNSCSCLCLNKVRLEHVES